MDNKQKSINLSQFSVEPERPLLGEILDAYIM